jgi:hypothetical protein
MICYYFTDFLFIIILNNIVLLPVFIFLCTVQNRVNHWVKILGPYVGIAIIGLMLINNVLFIHTHKQGDGKIVVHAHPYKKNADSTPYKTHSHSSSEYILINNLSIFLVTSFLIFIAAKPGHFIKRACSYHFAVIQNAHDILKGRSPPGYVY